MEENAVEETVAQQQTKDGVIEKAKERQEKAQLMQVVE